MTTTTVSRRRIALLLFVLAECSRFFLVHAAPSSSSSASHATKSSSSAVAGGAAQASLKQNHLVPASAILFTEGGSFVDGRAGEEEQAQEQPSAAYYPAGWLVAEQQQQQQPSYDEASEQPELPEVLYAQAMLERVEAQRQQQQQQQALLEAQQRRAEEALLEAEQQQQHAARLAEARRRAALIAAAVQDARRQELLSQQDYFIPAEQEMLSSGEKDERQAFNAQASPEYLQSSEKQQQEFEAEQIADESLANFGADLARVAAARAHHLNGSKQGKTSSLSADAKQKGAKIAAVEKELPDAAVESKSPPKMPMKKGQYEFVEFVEPHQSAKYRGIESMEKRVPVERFGADAESRLNMFMNTSNLVFIAAVAMCCVMAASATAGGMYYYKRIRTARDDPFDEFMRYSPTGPGRDKLKKAHLPPSRCPSASPTGGDDTLAYRAQLQHYRQTKQRIIGGPVGLPPDHVVIPAISDDEDDDDLDKHNFRSGDIEVQNPNFVGSAGGSSGRRGSGSVKSPSPAPSQTSDHE